MSSRTGLNNNKFTSGFQTTGNETTPFATTTYVDGKIEENLISGVAVDINFLNAGVCVFGVSGTNKTIVNIGICTSLGDLSDVNFVNPLSSGDYLLYNGVSWTTGGGASNFSITNLTDFYAPGGLGNSRNGFLQVNNTGTSIILNTTDVVSDIVEGNGIVVTNSTVDSTSKIVSLDTGSVTTTNTDSVENHFIISDQNRRTRKIKKDKINLTGFNTGNFVQSSNISAQVIGTGACPSMLTTSSTGPGVSIILDTTNIMTSVGGVLPISKGGTGASTIASAQIGLSLEPNKDIVKYSRGRFINNITGDNIKLSSTKGTITLNNPGGTGYISGTCIRRIGNFGATILATATPGGSIVSLDGGLSLFPHISKNYDNLELLNETGAVGTGASVSIGLCYTYLIFGASSGIGNSQFEDQLGIRYNTDLDQVEFKGTSSDGWRLLTNRFGVSELTTVCSAGWNPQGGDILVYDNTINLWRDLPVSGQGTLDRNGVFGVSIFPPDINLAPVTLARISREEMAYLLGTSSNIQEQLDSKIQVDTTLNEGDLIYYGTSSSRGVSIFTKLPHSTVNSQYTFLKEYAVNGSNLPAYENLSAGFKQLNVAIPTSNDFCLIESGASEAQSYSLARTNEYLIGKSIAGVCSGFRTKTVAPGLGTLQMDHNNLTEKTSVATEDLMTIQTNIASGVSPVQKITVQNFISGIAGGSGICVSTGGKLQLSVDVGVCPIELGGGPNYDGRLAYFYGPTSLGPSILAVNYQNSWYGTCMVLVT